MSEATASASGRSLTIFYPTRSSSHPRQDVSRSGFGRKRALPFFGSKTQVSALIAPLRADCSNRLSSRNNPSHRFNGGLGLGLAISKKLAELQGCSLSGESPGPGRGATFTLTLPLAAASPATTIPSDELPLRTDRGRVLLIEDNKDVSDALTEVISLFGFEVDVAYDGRSALTRAIAAPPDLILCDVGLPGGMDGYAVARALRTEPRLRLARLIAVSGYSQPKDHADAKQAGFDRLVSKPITVETLKALLNEPTLQS